MHQPGRNTIRTTTRSGLAVVAAGMAAALAISMLGPSYLADGSSAVALICLHIIVGVVLITGFMPALLGPYRAAGYRPSRG